jgi:hypothetical protein
MEVLIVAKTLMKKACCVGAYDITNRKNIRLLNFLGENQPLYTKFEVGQIWEIDYKPKPIIALPHSEDVLVKKSILIKTQPNLNEFILSNIPIWKGNPNTIFEGKIKFPSGHSGFLEKANSDLTQSVGFWLPDKDLELTIFNDSKHYFYFGEQVYQFPYVGIIQALEKIPKGAVIRVSLTRWWTPDKEKQEKRCYCQISGWY